jgi:hypothetical protein
MSRIQYEKRQSRKLWASSTGAYPLQVRILFILPIKGTDSSPFDGLKARKDNLEANIRFMIHGIYTLMV